MKPSGTTLLAKEIAALVVSIALRLNFCNLFSAPRGISLAKFENLTRLAASQLDAKSSVKKGVLFTGVAKA